jgi:hypothetical protein
MNGLRRIHISRVPRSVQLLAVLGALAVALGMVGAGGAARMAAPAPAKTVKAVIGAPTTSPKKATAGKRFTVTFPVRRSDNHALLKTGKMTCDPKVAGKVLRHSESFKNGKARLSFLIPKNAAGKKVKVTVAIKVGNRLSRRVASFRIKAAAATTTLDPIATISDVSMREGDSGTAMLRLPVTLSAPAPRAGSIHYATSDGTATAGSDYQAAAGTLTFKAGETAGMINVAVRGDTAYEPDETFTVTLSNPVHVKLARTVATGTIVNDDVAPASTKPGHYTGTYTDGTYFNFDVGSTGATIFNIAFDFNGHCPGYGTSYGHWTLPGPFGLQLDGSFSVNQRGTVSNGSAAIAISGRVSPDGSASGSLRIDMAFSDGINCASSGTWSAHVG